MLVLSEVILTYNVPFTYNVNDHWNTFTYNVFQ